MTDLSGKAIVITGASSGIGRTLAIALGAAGADLWLLGRSSAELATTATMAASTRLHKLHGTITQDAALGHRARMIVTEEEKRVTAVHDVGKAFMEGTRRLALGSGYEPSRMVWLNDEHTDVVVYNWRPGASLQYRNGYADINKGVLSYCDGHSKYTTVRPGATVETFSNTDYTFVFDP